MLSLQAANPKAIFPIFSPVVETGNPNGFLTDNPTKLFTTGKFIKVPVIAGINENEGGFFYLGKYFHMYYWYFEFLISFPNTSC